MNIRLVGRVGVAPVELSGGPLDGERRMAVVGAPLCCVVPRKEAKSPTPLYGAFTDAFFGTVPGDEWKEEQKQAQGKANAVYAVYLPDIVDGKATMMLRFAGAFEHIPLP